MNIIELMTLASFVAFIGGTIFGVVSEAALPFFNIPAVPIRPTMLVLTVVSLMFWTTWILPLAVLLLILAQPITITILLTIVFAFWIAGVLISTFILGKIHGVPDD